MPVFLCGLFFLGLTGFDVSGQDPSPTNISVIPETDFFQQNKSDEFLSVYVQRRMQTAQDLFTASPEKRDVQGAKTIWKEVGQLSAENVYQQTAMLIGQAALASGNFEAAKKALTQASLFLGPLTNQVSQISPAAWASEDWSSPSGRFLVRICSANGESLGTGALISPDGLILTAAHVVAEQTKLYAHLWDGRFLEVTGINGGDLKNDLAFLRVPGSELPFTKLGNSPASAGDDVWGLGFPLGSLWPVKTKGRFERAMGSTSDLALISAPGLPGMSGGPILNAKEELVGIFCRITGGKVSDPKTAITTLKAIRAQYDEKPAKLSFVPLAEAVEWKQKSPQWSKEEIEKGTDVASAAALLKTEPTKAISLLEKLASEGNATAQEVLSETYLENISTPEDLDQGLKWLKKAAESGRPNSQTRLGICMLRGNEQDRKEAIGWFRKAADQSFPGGLMMLGMATYGGYCGLEKDPELGKKYLQKAADMGDRFAISALAGFRIKESGWNSESQKYVLGLANQLASNGDPLGNEILAGFYATGTIMDKDLKKAADLFKAAAISGSSKAGVKYAQVRVMELTQAGKTADAETLQDCEKWCVQSGELGNSNGYALAFGLYLDRKKLLKESAADDISVGYIEKAISMGNGAASFQYGKLLATGGSGFKKDHKRALELFEEAAKKGIPGAGTWIGMVKLEMDHEKK